MKRISHSVFPSEKRPGNQRLLSVLYVDDDPMLLNLGKAYLEQCHDLFVTTAEDVGTALRLLEIFNFDVIISDYQMPVTNGIDFLKTLQEHGCAIPFILFTGKGREEIVIEAINNGATFYIQKGGEPGALFAELSHKIREASRRRHAESALREIELQFSTLFEYSGTAILTLDDDLVIARVNTGFCRLTGYTREEVEGRLRWMDFIAADDIDNLRNQYSSLRRGQIPAITGFGIQIITKNNQIRKISATAAIIPTTDWSIVSLVESYPPVISDDILRKESDGQYRIENTA